LLHDKYCAQFNTVHNVIDISHNLTLQDISKVWIGFFIAYVQHGDNSYYSLVVKSV